MTIYTPKHFSESRLDLIHEIIKNYSFATLVSVRDNIPIFSHLPFLFDAAKGEQGTLVAHIARANPQWRSFRTNAEVTVLFHGPHAYISPRWYAPQLDNVPTWNYAVVHAYGVPTVLQTEEEAFSVMKRLVQHHDPEWTLALSEQDRRELLREIVVFEICITKIEAKFKLSQNRSKEDQLNRLLLKR